MNVIAKIIQGVIFKEINDNPAPFPIRPKLTLIYFHLSIVMYLISLFNFHKLFSHNEYLCEEVNKVLITVNTLFIGKADGRSFIPS